MQLLDPTPDWPLKDGTLRRLYFLQVYIAHDIPDASQYSLRTASAILNTEEVLTFPQTPYVAGDRVSITHILGFFPDAFEAVYGAQPDLTGLVNLATSVELSVSGQVIDTLQGPDVTGLAGNYALRTAFGPPATWTRTRFASRTQVLLEVPPLQGAGSFCGAPRILTPQNCEELPSMVFSLMASAAIEKETCVWGLSSAEL